MSVLEKFANGSLTKQDIESWVKKQSEGKLLSNEETSHVANCLTAIFKWYHEGYEPGHFLSSVLRNNFMSACTSADSTNSKVLPLYAKFLYNCVPGDYVTKIKRNMSG